MPIQIRKMREEDLPEVLTIEQKVYPHPWTPESFEFEVNINPVARTWVAEEWEESILTVAARQKRLVVGYLVAWVIEDELHIGNVATHPDFRRRGIAKQLLHQIMDFSIKEKCRIGYLEVRSTNQAAIALCQEFGFSQYQIRNNYYGDDDAWMMKKDLDPIPTFSSITKAG